MRKKEQRRRQTPTSNREGSAALPVAKHGEENGAVCKERDVCFVVVVFCVFLFVCFLRVVCRTTVPHTYRKARAPFPDASFSFQLIEKKRPPKLTARDREKTHPP